MARAIECALARYMLIGIFIGLNLSVLMEIKDARKEIECVVIKHIYTYKRYGNYQTIVCEVMYFSFLFCSLFFICRFLRRCSWKIVYSISNNDFNIYIYICTYATTETNRSGYGHGLYCVCCVHETALPPQASSSNG